MHALGATSDTLRADIKQYTVEFQVIAVECVDEQQQLRVEPQPTVCPERKNGSRSGWPDCIDEIGSSTSVPLLNASKKG